MFHILNIACKLYGIKGGFEWGFLKLKKRAAKSEIKTKHMNILPKNEFENGQYYCNLGNIIATFKCKIMYDGIVSYLACLEINAEQQYMQILSAVFTSLMQLLVTSSTTKIPTY